MLEKSPEPTPYRQGLIVFIIAATLGLISFFFFDQRVSQFFENEEIMEFRLFNREITDIGLSIHYFVISATLFLIAVICGRISRLNWSWRIRMQHWAAKFFLSLLVSGVTGIIFKMLIGRERPHKSAPVFDPAVFDPFTTHWHYQSMPSGHSQVLFCVATMLSVLLPKWKVTFYGLAAFLASTRVITHNHFVSDCIMGAFVGYFFTALTCYHVDRWLKKRAPAGQIF